MNTKGEIVDLTEQKPNFKKPRVASPQSSIYKAKISPNAMEGKDRPGLKDLAKLVDNKAGNENPTEEPTGNKGKDLKPEKATNKRKKPKGKNRGGKRGAKALRSIDPHVEVEYQEKSTVEVPTLKRQASPVSLSTPVSNPDNYDPKDVSADGFKARK